MRPVVEKYLRKLGDRLSDTGYIGPVLIILSHGGVAPIDEAVRLAAGTVLSGPAGGVAGSRYGSSLIGAEKDVCPLFKKVAFSILVEESVIYALSPTAILSSITAPSICTPLVLISNAAYPNPEVFAFGPPVPLSSKFSKMAFVSKFN